MTTAAATPPGTVHVEHCMGTVFTIAIKDGGRWGPTVDQVLAWLHRVDALFSTYRPDSDISRLRAGELTVAGADPLVREVLDLCEDYERRTGGFFSAHLPGGLDPTGLVKGWAIERASELLHRHGSANHVVNGGGDMQLAGQAAPGRRWSVGISDPFDTSRIVAVVTGRDFAVATSGVGERGAHIIEPHCGQAARDLASVSVVGRSLTSVDAYATAAFAMGPAALGWIEAQPGLEGLVIATDGGSRHTRGFPDPADDWLPPPGPAT